MTQHKAFRLADDLESGWCPVESPSQMKEAAAELRRLHAQRDALLEALRLIAGLITDEPARQKALDAIAKVEENT